MNNRILEEAERQLFKSAMKNVDRIHVQSDRRAPCNFPLSNRQKKIPQTLVKQVTLSSQNQGFLNRKANQNVAQLNRRIKARIGKGRAC